MASSSAARSVGTLIDGKYQIDEVLGEGGMGIVVSATRIDLGSAVALKFLREDYIDDSSMVRRFTQEARTAGKLKSEHVCKVFDAGQLADGTPYIVMERLVGDDLGTLCKKNGPFDHVTACRLLLDACAALEEAHAAGLVHRDLKPNNLFLVNRGDGGTLLKVLDFGIVKNLHEVEGMTMTDANMGTPAYMSPEQLRSTKHVDHRTDIWAMGVILYELVSGRRPFTGESSTDMAINIATQQPLPLTGNSVAIQPVVDRCLRKQPALRYISIAALRADLELLLRTGRVRPSTEDAVTVELASNSSQTLGENERAPSVPLDPRSARRVWPLVRFVVPVGLILAIAIGLVVKLTANGTAPVVEVTPDAGHALPAVAPVIDAAPALENTAEPDAGEDRTVRSVLDAGVVKHKRVVHTRVPTDARGSASRDDTEDLGARRR